jgi:hypothetical protein
MLRQQGQKSKTASPLTLPDTREHTSRSVSPAKRQEHGPTTLDSTAAVVEGQPAADDSSSRDPDAEEPQQQRKRKIFDNLVVYVNGSTHPIISDHKLKHLLAENGACMAFHLGRRRVTHVILGRPGAVGHGAGGGLAGGKMEREIRRVGGCGIKYVGVEW